MLFVSTISWVTKTDICCYLRCWHQKRKFSNTIGTAKHQQMYVQGCCCYSHAICPMHLTTFCRCGTFWGYGAPFYKSDGSLEDVYDDPSKLFSMDASHITSNTFDVSVSSPLKREQGGLQAHVLRARAHICMARRLHLLCSHIFLCFTRGALLLFKNWTGVQKYTRWQESIRIFAACCVPIRVCSWNECQSFLK